MPKLLKENNINVPLVLATMDDNAGMSRTIRNSDLIVGYDTVAREMQEFMFEGRPGRSKRKQHTEEEWFKYMQKMTKKLWKFHNAGIQAIKDEENLANEL